MFKGIDPPARGEIALVRMSDIGADCNAPRAAGFRHTPVSWAKPAAVWCDVQLPWWFFQNTQTILGISAEMSTPRVRLSPQKSDPDTINHAGIPSGAALDKDEANEADDQYGAGP